MGAKRQEKPPEEAPALPWVAPALRAKLAKLGLARPFDLVLHLPLRYEDETRVSAIRDLLPGLPAQVEGVITHREIRPRPRRQLLATLEDASGSLVLRFLNFYPSQAAQLSPGARLRVYGELRPGFLGDEMVHPRVRTVGEETALPEALTPVYPTTAGVSQAALRAAIAKALAHCDLADSLPADVTRRLSLAPFGPSVRLLHQPTPDIPARSLDERSHPAWRRLKFDELLAQQLSMRRHYRERRSRSAPPLPPLGELTARLRERLPFSLTAAQERALAEISADLARPHPMQRLLQGDVGSGKTVVAALAALQAVENGCQAAVMAPTEILAEQHRERFSAWLEPLGVRLGWLSGQLPKREREAVRAALAAGDIQVVVGTHALVQDPVAFQRLGLAIVDEQHRFGVQQRLALRGKGGDPHQLMMSATPIPRTLSMSYYADLDLSVIDELPPGRTPVVTKLVAESRRDQVLERVRRACAGGRQAYWVCPLIEESEALELATATETHAALAAALPELAVGLVHGRMAAAEKQAVMEAVQAGRVQVLVSTTVVEVGVDVPNASLMVIEHAERLGLAQLHQLRGRVGRGAAESACILLYQAPLSETARARLKVIYEHHDGFEIARQDLLLRGPGEFLGARQSGAPMLRFADIEADADLLQAARRVADELLERHPEAAAAHLARWLGGRESYLKV